MMRACVRAMRLGALGVAASGLFAMAASSEPGSPFSTPLPSAARGAIPVALSRIEPGQWVLRDTDGSGELRRICVTDPNALIQVAHPRTMCSRFVIADDPNAAVVHYTCPGAGHGHTAIKVETPRLIQIETQGLLNGMPFQWSLEGRRIGTCPAGTPGFTRR